MNRKVIDWLNDIELPYVRDRAIHNYTQEFPNYNDDAMVATCMHHSVNSFYWGVTAERGTFWCEIYEAYKKNTVSITHDRIKIGDIVTNESGRFFVFFIRSEKILEEVSISLLKEDDFTIHCITRFTLNYFLVLLDNGVFKHG